MTTLYALGHSTRPFDKFIELLRAHGITLLADIRTIPRSRRNPQYNRESLEEELPKAQIAYRHLKELGGLRRPSKDSVNTAWENDSFRGYADYMQTAEFDRALQNLLALAEGERVAIMCAEGNPFRCHRLLVADALTVCGVRVLHISSRKSAKEHQITPFARVNGSQITYPKEEGSKSKRTNPIRLCGSLRFCCSCMRWLHSLCHCCRMRTSLSSFQPRCCCWGRRCSSEEL